RRTVASYAFATMADALEASRRILRVGWRPGGLRASDQLETGGDFPAPRAGGRPGVRRAYDQLETGRHFSAQAPADKALLLVVTEGPSAMVEAEAAACGAPAQGGGGTAA